MEGMENPFSYLGVWVGGNGIGRREHSFISIPLKPEIFIPLKLGRMGRNEIRFNEFFTKNFQNTPKYSTLYFKIGI